MATAFIGVDMAWQSDSKPAGAVAAIGDSARAEIVAAEPALQGLDALLDFVHRHSGETTVVAIDAPLIVQNERGQRPCEKEIGRRFGRFKASAHATNLSRHSNPASVRLASSLKDHGFQHPRRALSLDSGQKAMFEVYTHPAMIQLFGLAERLQYRNGPVAARRRGLVKLGELLSQRLPRAQPSLVGTDALVLQVEVLRGRALKSYEDVLDAAFCSYLALNLWSLGPAGNEMIGDLETGYIVNPTKPLVSNGP